MDDRRARFEALVLPHLDAAYRFARWLSPAPGEAEDVVQEAFLRALRGFDGLRGGDVKAWLLMIVRNCHNDALRQRQRHGNVAWTETASQAVAADTPDPESESISREAAATLERLVARLPAEQREVVLLRELEEMSYREIAAIAQVPIGTVMSRLARARAALRLQWLRETTGAPRAVR